MRILITLLLAFMVVTVRPDLGVMGQVFAQEKTFTVEELAQYNGKDGAPAYTSYEGVIYDVSSSPLWKNGEHFGLQAGIDLTEAMARAPHGAEVFSGFTVVGVLEGFVSPNAEQPSVEEPTPELAASAAANENTWYGQRLRIMGYSILGLTGILLGIAFILTFATCFAMPWAQLKLPWVGSRPGPDPLDASGKHMPWSGIHKHFVWITVILGVIHGLLGLLQMWGIYL
jgi:predicted heme/steroid binding protein